VDVIRIRYQVETMNKSLAAFRENYKLGSLRRRDLLEDPFAQFELWFSQAAEAGVPEPNAMTLSTVSPEGRPSSRVVLLKEMTKEGFVFYTNQQSRKGHEISANPYASLLFFWSILEQQVRIEGDVAMVDEEEADTYFRSRPSGSRLGAWVSEQSTVIPSRAWLDERLERFSKDFDQMEIPRPPHWGGYLIKPTLFEFWQGRENRLHDRFIYLPHGDGWKIERLSP
jgi:pyridoxamine 5'-phosphate oxidase